MKIKNIIQRALAIVAVLGAVNAQATSYIYVNNKTGSSIKVKNYLYNATPTIETWVDTGLNLASGQEATVQSNKEEKLTARSATDRGAGKAGAIIIKLEDAKDKAKDIEIKFVTYMKALASERGIFWRVAIDNQEAYSGSRTKGSLADVVSPILITAGKYKDQQVVFEVPRKKDKGSYKITITGDWSVLSDPDLKVLIEQVK